MAGIKFVSPSAFGSFHKKPPNKKAPAPPKGTRTEIHSAVPPCLPEDPTAQHGANTPSAFNAGITSADTRKNSLSLCPRRPICCSAFRSALSYAKLSVDALRSFTSASMVCICAII